MSEVPLEVSKIVSAQDENESHGQSLSPKRMRVVTEPGLQSPPPTDGRPAVRPPLADTENHRTRVQGTQSPPRPGVRRSGLASPQSPCPASRQIPYMHYAPTNVSYPPTSPLVQERTAAPINVTEVQGHVPAYIVPTCVVQRTSVSPRRSVHNASSLSLTEDGGSYTPANGNAQRLSSAPSDVENYPTSSTASLTLDHGVMPPNQYMVSQAVPNELAQRHPRMTVNEVPPRLAAEGFRSPQRCRNLGNERDYIEGIGATRQVAIECTNESIGGTRQVVSWVEASVHLNSLTQMPTTLPQKLQSQYTLCEGDPNKLLGYGAFACVVKIKTKSEHIVSALKVINKKELEIRKIEENAKREMMYQKDALNHRNIVRCQDAFEDDGHYWMVMEYANMGSLTVFRAGCPDFSESHAAWFLKQVAQAMQYLHQEPVNIIHRDIKAENVLVYEKDGHPVCAKLSDFGWSCSSKPYINEETQMIERPQDRAGTPPHMAPEVFYSQFHSVSADCWSFAVTLYEVLLPPPHGGPCFNFPRCDPREKPICAEDELNFNLGKYNDPEKKSGVKVSANVKDLWQKLFTDQCCRLSASGILEHAFCTSVGDQCPRVTAPPMPQTCGTGASAMAEALAKNDSWKSLGNLQINPPVTPAASSHAPRGHLTAARESPRNNIEGSGINGFQLAAPRHFEMQTVQPLPATRGVAGRSLPGNHLVSTAKAGGDAQAKAPAKALAMQTAPPKAPIPNHHQAFRAETPGPRVNAARHSTVPQGHLVSTQAPARAVGLQRAQQQQGPQQQAPQQVAKGPAPRRITQTNVAVPKRC